MQAGSGSSGRGSPARSARSTSFGVLSTWLQAVLRQSRANASLGHPNCTDWVLVEAYSHELSSSGFWPGGGEEGAFYSDAYPVAGGFRRVPGSPAGVLYHPLLRQYLLPSRPRLTAGEGDGRPTTPGAGARALLVAGRSCVAPEGR
ncbi:DUF5996 family protein [Mycobacterium sp. NPDC003449]